MPVTTPPCDVPNVVQESSHSRVLSLWLNRDIVSSLQTITALYGETIKVPCNPGGAKPANHMFTKWKYDIPGSTPGNLLVKQANIDEVTIQATGIYKDRVSMGNDSSLLISRATLEDQKVFTCMEVGPADIKEYSTNVLVYKKPSAPQIKDKVKELENGKLTAVGECITQDANPPANITWSKNGNPLTDDGKLTVITTVLKKDPATGLTTTSSKLQYTAMKEDVDSTFTCSVHHQLGPDQVSAPETFSIIYPTEMVDLQVINKGLIKEGDNVTLKCKADGNPPPTSFNFHLKAMTVENSDTYTLIGVNRNSTGEYKCSLVNNDKMVDSESIIVHYLDLTLNPSGKIIKNFGEGLVAQVQKNASAEVKISWTKDNNKLDKQPEFDQLKYSDSGIYECVASMEGITEKRSFQLAVEGKPMIKKLDKKRGQEGKHKVLICEVEGSPKPTVQWSVNGTYEESPYIDGRVTYKIIVVPTENLTVTCVASNKLGEDTKAIVVSSRRIQTLSVTFAGTSDEEGDQAQLIVGVVVGLILAAVMVGIVYWIYQKKSKQGEQETGGEQPQARSLGSAAPALRGEGSNRSNEMPFLIGLAVRHQTRRI
ncbi:CD166 antigen isoform X2 [Arapaima gigas]